MERIARFIVRGLISLKSQALVANSDEGTGLRIEIPVRSFGNVPEIGNGTQVIHHQHFRLPPYFPPPSRLPCTLPAAIRPNCRGITKLNSSERFPPLVQSKGWKDLYPSRL